MKIADGAIVWITGASSGIGRALAVACARRGWIPVLSGRDRERLEETRAMCAAAAASAGAVTGIGAAHAAGAADTVGAATGLGAADTAGAVNAKGGPDIAAVVLPLDVTDAKAIGRAVREVESRFGHVDVLINNAGISQRAAAADTGLEVTRRMFEVNFFSAVAMTKAVLPGMQARRSGAIAVVTSVSGRMGVRMRSSYCASKHALHGYFDALRSEVWQDGIGVTILVPGYVNTSISVNALDGSGKAAGLMDRAQAEAMSAERCAQVMLKAIAAGAHERTVALDFRSGSALFMKKLAPRLLDRAMRTARVT